MEISIGCGLIDYDYMGGCYAKNFQIETRMLRRKGARLFIGFCSSLAPANRTLSRSLTDLIRVYAVMDGVWKRRQSCDLIRMILAQYGVYI